MSVIFACDLGGTSFRAALVDEKGAILASWSTAMSVPIDQAGCSEADPAIWWQAFVDSASALRVMAPDLFPRVAAIAISAITRTQVFIDRERQVLRPAILWRDTRAESVLPQLRALCPPDHPESVELNAFHPLARLAWLKRAEPDTFARATSILEPKDYLHLKLTGVVASDRISLARLAAAARPSPSGQSLFESFSIPVTLLPQLLEPLAIMGCVRRDIAGALDSLVGVPVIAMANDTWASVVGLGAMRDGCGYNLSGTSEVFGIISGHAAQAEGLLTVEWGGGLNQVGGPSQTGGDTLAWLLTLLREADGARTSEALDCLLAEEREGDPVIFLPYLQGERVPYWDPALRGAFVGLNRRHRAVDLAYAVMEGIAFLNRIVLERAETASGIRVDEIRFGGGGAANLPWRQIKADVLGRPVVVPDGHEHGLIGAAVAAFVAIGRFPDMEMAQRALTRSEHVCRPDRARGERYDRLFEIFKSADAALAPIGRRLIGWTSGTAPVRSGS